MSKKESDKDQILTTAKERARLAEDYWQGIFLRGKEDTEFAYGDQWSEKIKAERKAEARPCLTENRLLPYIHQVVNSIRQQRPKMRPVPNDDKSDVEVADILKGVIINIEKQSDAETAYDTAAKNAVEGGLGFIRIRTDYTSYDSFDQEIKIERILNPSSVLLDPMHKNLDGSDAEWCFIYEDMQKEEFERQYPDATMDAFDNEVMNEGWATDETVRIAEYYYKDYETKTIVKLSSGETMFKEDVEDESLIEQERETEVGTVKWCKLTANDILEETTVDGIYIPVVPVVGEEAYLNGKREMFSLIHQAKDPQFMLNVWKSASTEVIGLQPKAPYVGAVGSFNTYAHQWSTANTKNYSFLQYDPVTVMMDNGQEVPLPPPQRQPPPTSSGSMMQEAMSAAESIKSCLGMYDASAGEQTNDVSGKAIIARQLKGDNATFHFVDNLSTALKQVGRILVDLIPLVYSQSTIVKITGEDGVTNKVALNQPYVKRGKEYLPAPEGVAGEGIIDLSVGKYDIDIDVGASYDTRRQEQANAILELARANPAILEVTGDLLVKSLDIPLAQEIAERIQVGMNPALLGDDPMAQAMKQMNDQIEQLNQQLGEAESAVLAKQNNQQFENEMKIEELKLKRQELELKAANSMAELNNKKLEVEAEAAKDYAQAAVDLEGLQTSVDDVREAVSMMLERDEVSGAPKATVITNEENVL